MGEKSLKIKIVYPGRIKNSFAKEGFEEYVKRCGRFYKTEVISLPSSRAQDMKKAIKEESEKVMKHIGDGKFILLDVNGEEKNSMEFAEMMRKYVDHGNDLIFVVGGVFGVDDELKKKASVRISLSKLTFTHSLSLLILAEQLYRSMKILHGQPYNH
jgi:23S rRNA (pseudouridine1915-N3)-methyltransferase